MIDNYESGGVLYSQRDTMIKCSNCGSVYVGSLGFCHSCVDSKVQIIQDLQNCNRYVDKEENDNVKPS
jgi:hypothetical protein